MQYICTSLCCIPNTNKQCFMSIISQKIKGKTTFIAIVLRELSQSCESLLKYKISGTTPLRQACLAQSFSHVQLFVTLWTVALQAPLPMGFPRQEHWSGSPFLSPGDLPHPGIEPMSPVLAGGFTTTEPLGKPIGDLVYFCKKYSCSTYCMLGTILRAL